MIPVSDSKWSLDSSAQDKKPFKSQEQKDKQKLSDGQEQKAFDWITCPEWNHRIIRPDSWHLLLWHRICFLHTHTYYSVDIYIYKIIIIYTIIYVMHIIDIIYI